MAQDSVLEEQHVALAGCVEKLIERDRDLVNRCYVPGVTIKQVAIELHRTPDATYKGAKTHPPRIVRVCGSHVERKGPQVSLAPQQLDDLHDMLWRLRADEATPRDVADIERLVRENADARAFYVRYMYLCADLSWNNAMSDGGRVARDEGEEGLGIRDWGLEARDSLTTDHWPPTTFPSNP